MIKNLRFQSNSENLIVGFIEFLFHLHREGAGGHLVEVGSYAGESSIMFQASGIFESIVFVDLWRDPLVKSTFTRRMGPDVKAIQAESVTASKKFEDASVDCIYIDADHRYRSVKRDLAAWMPKVRPGGFISGHDYVKTFPGVRRAVREVCPESKDLHVFSDGSWIFRKDWYPAP